MYGPDKCRCIFDGDLHNSEPFVIGLMLYVEVFLFNQYTINIGVMSNEIMEVINGSNKKSNNV